MGDEITDHGFVADPQDDMLCNTCGEHVLFHWPVRPAPATEGEDGR